MTSIPLSKQNLSRMDAMAEIILAAGAAATITARADDVPTPGVADPEAATDPGEHAPTPAEAIAGRAKPDTPLTRSRKLQR